MFFCILLLFVNNEKTYAYFSDSESVSNYFVMGTTYTDTFIIRHENIDVAKVNKLNYIGYNVFNIPYVGYGIRWIQTPKGKIISGTIIACLTVFSFLFGNDKDKKKLKN